MSSVKVSPVDAVEDHDAHAALQADEEVVLAALVVVEAADHAALRPREIRLPDRRRQSAAAGELAEPAALVLVPAEREELDDHLLAPVCSISRPTSARSAQCLPPSCHQPSTRRTRSSPRAAYSRLTSVISSSPRLGRLERVDDVADARRVAVEAHDRVVRRRLVVAEVDHARLLDDVRHPALLVVGDDTEADRVGDLLHEHERAVLPGGDRLRLGVLEDVVAEADDQLLAAREVAGHPDHLRDPARLDLHLVAQVEIEEQLVAGARPQPPVAEQVDEVARVLPAGHEQHLVDTGPLEQLERVVDHRPAADGQQVLVGDARQLLEPRRRPACADQPLHAGADATAGPPGSRGCFYVCQEAVAPASRTR